MGVWIEIVLSTVDSVCWLVTPCVGVWIEILICLSIKAALIIVTPCVGVWIEIRLIAQI